MAGTLHHMAVNTTDFEKTVEEKYQEKADYENPDFRMMMASSAGSISSAVCGSFF